MKTLYIFLSAALLIVCVLNFSVMNSEASVSASRAIQFTVVPNVNENVAATLTFLGPLANSQRTYQLLINESELVNVLGQNLKGLTFRIPTNATANWPTADISYGNYDIYLSRSVAPANRSLTFINNVAGPQTQVRSGALTILANSFTFGGNPNAFGTDITFNTPYLYTGGHLLVEIRHGGFTGTSRSVEATGTAVGGYGTLFSACWTGSYIGVAGSAGNFSTVRFSSEADVPTLKLTALIEGFYDQNTNLMVSDTARVYVRNNTSPYGIVDSSVHVLDSTGKGIFQFLNAADSVDYYLFFTHRNSINTWSDTGYSFINNLLTYDFTTSDATAFGNNLKLKGARWTVFSGDVLRDGSVDAADVIAVYNDATVFASGYIVTDVNGDDFADATDLLIVYNNASNFVAEIAP